MDNIRKKQLRDVRSAILRLGGWFGEDVYQDVCIFAYRHTEIDWNKPQQGRLVRLARVIIQRRRHKIGRRRKKKAMCFSDVSSDFDASSIPDPGIFPTYSQGIRDAVGRAIERLPQRRRRALELFMGGRSDEETAVLLGIRKELVRQWRHRDVQRLQAIVLVAT